MSYIDGEVAEGIVELDEFRFHVLRDGVDCVPDVKVGGRFGFSTGELSNSAKNFK